MLVVVRLVNDIYARIFWGFDCELASKQNSSTMGVDKQRRGSAALDNLRGGLTRLSLLFETQTQFWQLLPEKKNWNQR